MRLSTKHFGELDYEPDRIITFPQGLPGFPDTRKYLLLEGQAPGDLVYLLQCIDDGDVAFTLIDLYQVMPDYNPMVEPDEMIDLGEIKDTPLEIYNITVIPEEVRQMRVNLKAPIVINPVTMRGRQVIVSNDEYNIRHYIFEELEKAGEAAKAESDGGEPEASQAP
ncbi:MAG: flagellar assembly protein FliW [Defluviitaleaceae bacterium]|nr:flagellar assembly protein FliW [Defluviitaleaceae bacterium]